MSIGDFLITETSNDRKKFCRMCKKNVPQTF